MIPQHPGKWKLALRELLSLISRVNDSENFANSTQKVWEDTGVAASFDKELQKELEVDWRDWRFFEVCKNVCFLKYPQEKLQGENQSSKYPIPSVLLSLICEYLLNHPDEFVRRSRLLLLRRSPCTSRK